MKVKKCTKCNKEKNEEEFSFKNKKNEKRSTICNECQRVYKNKWYHKHKHNKENFRLTRLKNKQKLKTQMLEFLIGKSCLDCGEKDIVTLDFDHKNPSEKVCNISTMLSNSFSWIKILKEIEKCEIRCSNCHRKKTAKQFGSYKLLK